MKDKQRKDKIKGIGETDTGIFCLEENAEKNKKIQTHMWDYITYFP